MLAEKDQSSSPLPTASTPARLDTPEPTGAEPTFHIPSAVTFDDSHQKNAKA